MTTIARALRYCRSIGETIRSRSYRDPRDSEWIWCDSRGWLYASGWQLAELGRALARVRTERGARLAYERWLREYTIRSCAPGDHPDPLAARRSGRYERPLGGAI